MVSGGLRVNVLDMCVPGQVAAEGDTQYSLAVLTRSIDLPLMVMGGISGFERAKETRSSFVLSQFTDIRLSFDHWTASVAARWRRLSVALAEHTSHSVLSSTYT